MKKALALFLALVLLLSLFPASVLAENDIIDETTKAELIEEPNAEPTEEPKTEPASKPEESEKPEEAELPLLAQEAPEEALSAVTSDTLGVNLENDSMTTEQAKAIAAVQKPNTGLGKSTVIAYAKGESFADDGKYLTIKADSANPWDSGDAMTLAGLKALSNTDVFVIGKAAKPDYLTFTSDSAFKVGLTKGNNNTAEYYLQYSTDKTNWEDWDLTAVPAAQNKNNEYVIYFRNGKAGDTYVTNKSFAIGSQGAQASTFKFESDTTDIRIAASGNINTLLDWKNPDTALGTAKDFNYAFYMLFYGCKSLTSAPALPATALAKACYGSMFSGCSALTAAPALPATTLADNCYEQMFYGCSSLVTAPALEAPTMKTSCYAGMFQKCYSLTTAPALPSTKLYTSCYHSMFSDCHALTTAPALDAKNLKQNCYGSMFSGCSSLTTAPALPAKNMEANCYSMMFANCTSLTSVPKLEPTALGNHCCNSMFYGCTSLFVTGGSASDYTWRIPINSGVATPVLDMVKNTAAGGVTVATPDSGYNYYKVIPFYTLTGAASGLPEEVTTGGVSFTVKDATNTDVAVTAAAEGVTVTAKANAVEGYNATLSAVDADGQSVSIGADGSFTMPAKKVTVTAAYVLDHAHSFTYSAEGAVITATCSDTDEKCPLTEKKVSVTLSAPDAGYTGEAYTGASLDSDAWTAAGLTAPTVKYVGRAGTSYTESDTAPTAAGKYTAKITVDTDKTASVDFVIGAAVIPEGGDTAYYATLAEAVAAAEADDTVVLLSDVTVTEGITVDKTFILNLNEKTITYAPTYTTAQYQPLFAARNIGQNQLHFTILGEGTINGPTGDAAAKYDSKVMITVEGNSALFYEDGTLTCGGKGSDGMYGIYALNGGILSLGTISGGPTVTSWFAAVGTNHDTAPAVVYISNGTYTSQAAPSEGDWWDYFCAPVYAAAAGEFTIAGGTFNGAYGISTRYGDIEQTIKVEGGTFNATKSAILYDEILPSGTGAKTKTLTKTSGVTTLAAPDGWYWMKGAQDTDPLTLTKRTTPDAPAAAVEGTHYTVNYETEKINAAQGYELATKTEGVYSVLSADAAVTPGGTYYVRVKATETSLPSGWVEFTVKSRPEAPAALTESDIVRTHSTVTVTDGKAGKQYVLHMEGTVEEQPVKADSKIDIEEDKPVVFADLDDIAKELGNSDFKLGVVIPATETDFASGTRDANDDWTGVNWYSGSLKSAPANAPEIAVTDCTVTDTTVTLPVSGTPNTYEYAIKPAEGDPVWSDTFEFTGLTPATDYTCLIRVKETDTAMPSLVKELTVYTKPATPTTDSYAVDPSTLIVTTTPTTGYEYAVKPEGENAPVWNDIPAVGAQLEADVIYILRVKANGNVPASESIEFQTKFTVEITVAGTDANGEYKWTGSAFDYANILTVTSKLSGEVKTPEKGYTYSFYMADDEDMTTDLGAPTAVGAYKAVVKVAADDPLYTGTGVYYFTILPVTDEKEYEAEVSYDKELDSTLVMVSTSDYETFVKVVVQKDLEQPEDLPGSNYDAVKGSIIVTLHEDYLQGLEPGTYTFSIVSLIPGTVEKYATVDYIVTIEECEYEKKIDLKENGTYDMKLSGNDAGKFTFTKSGSGWTIQDPDSGMYLAYVNGKVTQRSEAFVWSYNGGFYTSVTTSERVFLWWYRTVTTNYYLNCDAAGSFSASTSYVGAELTQTGHSDRHHYVFRYVGGEKHEKYCSECAAVVETVECDYDSSTHKCKSCGYLDPDSIQYTVTITKVKTYNSSLLTRLLHGSYTYTAIGIYSVKGDSVAKVEFSLDGKRFSLGHTYSAYEDFDFYLRITTASGAVSEWKYENGTTVRVS